MSAGFPDDSQTQRPLRPGIAAVGDRDQHLARLRPLISELIAQDPVSRSASGEFQLRDDVQTHLDDISDQKSRTVAEVYIGRSRASCEAKTATRLTGGIHQYDASREPFNSSAALVTGASGSLPGTTQKSSPLDAPGRMSLTTLEPGPRFVALLGAHGITKGCNILRGREAMQTSSTPRPPGYGEASPHPASSQQLAHSLDECRGRIGVLRARLSAIPPTAPPNPEGDDSAFDGLHQRVLALSPDDQPAVDASLTAIGRAAQHLLRDLEGPFDGSRAPSVVAGPSSGVSARFAPPNWE
jgi:hypothetical protein